MNLRNDLLYMYSKQHAFMTVHNCITWFSYMYHVISLAWFQYSTSVGSIIIGGGNHHFLRNQTNSQVHVEYLQARIMKYGARWWFLPEAQAGDIYFYYQSK